MIGSSGRDGWRSWREGEGDVRFGDRKMEIEIR